MAPLATGGRYVNFMAAEDRGAAGPPVYDTRAGERLAARSSGATTRRTSSG
jgi:hypothetical protein